MYIEANIWQVWEEILVKGMSLHCNNRDGWDTVGGGKKTQREGTYVYL